ncbi:MAG: hypothetical protein OXF50_22735 [Caldilineaceae bacterium]|nr:hypothetical protein [Caldilineaceae bacterium]
MTVIWDSSRSTLFLPISESCQRLQPFAVPFDQLFALLLALLPGQALPGSASFGTVEYLPAAESGAAVAMLWIWVFSGEIDVVRYR